jgi:hypothetical protein
MDETQNIQIPLGEYLALKELEKKGQSIKFERVVHHTQRGEAGHTTSSISWHLPHGDADLERQLSSQISTLITHNRSLFSLLKELVSDFSSMTRAEFRAWQKRIHASDLEDFMKEEFVTTDGENEVYEKQQNEITELKALLKSIAEQSQLVLDKPKYKLSEDHCNGIRTALGDIFQKPAAEESPEANK